MIRQEKQKNKEILSNALKLQNSSRESILSVMQSFGESTDSIDIGSTENVKVFLDDLKSSLELCNESISTLERLANNIDYIPFSGDESISSYTSFSAQVEPQKNEDTFTPKIIEAYSTPEEAYKEKTLIISEMTKKVILPYEISVLKKKLENTSKYSSIDEIIKKEYSLPISMYKNPFISRFRESYKLMRNKEKSSIKEAFDLGLELMFNYNLHPAIISACKDIDELDIYLDYLDSGETDKFDFFKVEFEMAPTVVKTKKHF